MTAKTPTHLPDRVRYFAAKLPNAADRRVTIIATAFNLLRAAAGKTAAIAAANFLANAADDARWSSVDIDFVEMVGTPTSRGWTVARQYGATEERIPSILLSALTGFSELLAEGALAADPELRQIDIFDALIAEAVEKDKANVAGKQGPAEICTGRLVHRIFKPEPFTPDVAAKIIGGLRPGLLRGVQGNDMRCLTFKRPDDDTLLVLLETGEMLWAPAAVCKILTTEEAYADVPAGLLAHVCLYAQDFRLHDIVAPIGADAIQAGILGNFTTLVHTITVSQEVIQPLVNIIDNDPKTDSMQGVTGPTGASLRLPVPDLPDTVVILEAQHSATGPYVTARLVDTAGGTDRVLMRLDQPRHDSAVGLYLFPHSKHAVAVRVQLW
jgi:hypothetical protein